MDICAVSCIVTYVSGEQFCRFCQHSIDWKRENMCSDHIVSKSHVRNKEKFNNNASKTTSLQTCITASTFKSSDSRKEFIEDFVAMCAEADIPLEKMTKLRPFLLKHCKQGGALPENVSSLPNKNNLINSMCPQCVTHYRLVISAL
uniref:U1-type domain-containing protein n=1 Tax=Amphiprion percula TaxID=161767 RepID=A0A3P8SXZ6_AMPPE